MRSYVLGLLHPAAIVRGQWAKSPAQVTYLGRARKLAEDLRAGLSPPVVDTSIPAPGAALFPTIDELEAWYSHPLTREGVAVDVEAAGPHLRAIGFCRLADLASVQVHFRRQGGGLYWPTRAALLAAVEWCDRVLADPATPKWMHGGMGYDVPRQLARVGFDVQGYAGDTMLLAHIASPEEPKGLQWLATRHMGVPVWKEMVKPEEEEGEGK